MWKFKAKLKLWPTSASPWHYIDVPKSIVDEIQQLPQDRGLLKVSAEINGVSWETSIMPVNKDSKMLPIKAPIRKELGLSLGDTVDISLSPKLD